MKKGLSIIFGACVLFTANAGLAANTSKTLEKQVMLYAKPDPNSDVEAILDPDVQLVPIFQQKDWLRVGNPANGQVGWVNTLQYHQAREAFYQPTIQTVFIHVDQDAHGKSTLSVVAYKNGAKLTDSEAKALYVRLREQQQDEYRQMQHFSLRVDDMMTRELITMHQFFDNAWRSAAHATPQIMEPAQLLPDLNNGQPNTK